MEAYEREAAPQGIRRRISFGFVAVCCFGVSLFLISDDHVDSENVDLFISLGLSTQALGLLFLVLLSGEIPWTRQYTSVAWGALFGVILVMVHDSWARDLLGALGRIVCGLPCGDGFVAILDTVSWDLTVPGRVIMGLFAISWYAPNSHADLGSIVLWQRAIFPSTWLGLLVVFSALRATFRLFLRYRGRAP